MSSEALVSLLCAVGSPLVTTILVQVFYWLMGNCGKHSENIDSIYHYIRNMNAKDMKVMICELAEY